MIALSMGFIAGAVHAVSGPDHLAAVAPLAADRNPRSRHAGLQWGLGHGAATLALGGAALLFRELLPLQALSAVSERLVGALLVGMGVWGLLRLLRARMHSHEHAHEGVRHEHPHVHAKVADNGASHRHSHAAFWIGALHGLAGGAHLALVMAALALPTAAESMIYLVFYGLGSMAAMTGVSRLVGGWAQSLCSRRDVRSFQRLSAACSLCALAVGLAWLVP